MSESYTSLENKFLIIDAILYRIPSVSLTFIVAEGNISLQGNCTTDIISERDRVFTILVDLHYAATCLFILRVGSQISL
jgi:hypothetical protein